MPPRRPPVSSGHRGACIDICMCYTYLMPHSRYDRLDDLLTRLHVARQRPSWRRRLLGGAGAVTNVSTLRALRAVEQHQQTGDGASIRDVAEYMGIEHSTASRTVAAVVAAGLLSKTSAADDQRRSVLVLTDAAREALAAVTDRRRELVAKTISDWPDKDVDSLVALLERLTDDFERAVSDDR